LEAGVTSSWRGDEAIVRLRRRECLPGRQELREEEISMNIPKLHIGHLTTDIPIVQGGMGVRVSLASPE
jgi:hypothetical protein